MRPCTRAQPPPVVGRSHRKGGGPLGKGRHGLQGDTGHKALCPVSRCAQDDVVTESGIGDYTMDENMQRAEDGDQLLGHTKMYTGFNRWAHGLDSFCWLLSLLGQSGLGNRTRFREQAKLSK